MATKFKYVAKVRTTTRKGSRYERYFYARAAVQAANRTHQAVLENQRVANTNLLKAASGLTGSVKATVTKAYRKAPEMANLTDADRFKPETQMAKTEEKKTVGIARAVIRLAGTKPPTAPTIQE